MERRFPDQVEHAGEDCELDKAVSAKLPTGCSVLEVSPSGHSLWVATVKIVVQLKDGTINEYFKKGARGAVGMDMMRGTFEAEQALYIFSPRRVPKPIGWGTYAVDPQTHFYLGQFVEMREDLPSATERATAVSGLHVDSMGKSSTGRFGFHVTTHLANVPVNNSWDPSWESFWKQQMKGLFDQEDHVHGTDDELTTLKTVFLHKVIPRYPGPLEKEGRSVTPCLIHSDLWPGNIKPKKFSDGLCIFDACAYWGHNEADLGICRNPRYKLGQPCTLEYLKRVPATEPTADFDGRNAVYAMKYHALLSIMYCSKDVSFRQTLKNELREIIDKAAQSIPD
ncbi:Fructosamine kinase-domain-containing protein [Colletotrichum godetiae]|uniref:protein-ribulosamine 3-kinase n=1 Tax=Colletotrichum godetiae TaxID=1209918 RepID=A0AAJ0AJW6_9PEZI|nr:Fructosamine kinase-domain-containing protein [Colletotrichum godetiae]KAK1675225.1 Fructosamine kinase-domain-containing protein [Colletotrichum godetiae]